MYLNKVCTEKRNCTICTIKLWRTAKQFCEHFDNNNIIIAYRQKCCWSSIIRLHSIQTNSNSLLQSSKNKRKKKKAYTLVNYVTNKDDNDLICIITYMILYYVMMRCRSLLKLFCFFSFVRCGFVSFISTYTSDISYT